MQPSSRWSKVAKNLFVAVPLVIFFVYLYGGLWERHGRSASPETSTRPIVLGAHAHSWWVDFFARLEAVRPYAPPTSPNGRPPFENWKPDIAFPRPEILDMTAVDEANLRASHARFVAELAEYATLLPYDSGSTGIVTTVDPKGFGMILSMVLVLRRSGSRLPVHVVMDSSTDTVETMCATTLRDLNAHCIFIQDVFAKLDSRPKIDRFQWKIVSILASPLQNVIFMDADALPVQNPDAIIEPGSEPYASTGLITWPDFWMQTASEHFYTIAGDIEVPPLTSRATSESGIMIVDKARHADTLLLSAYYNYYGPDFYYAMLTQHGPGEGDKETYFQAALVLESLAKKENGSRYDMPTGWMDKSRPSVKKGYWDVKLMPRSHGRTLNGEWRGMFMQQADPMEDYRAVMAAIEKDRQEKGHAPTAEPNPGAPTATNSTTTTDVASTQHDEMRIEDFITDSTFLERTGNLTIERKPGSIMFFHHNGVKPDFTSINSGKSGIIAKDNDGRYVRMWGDPKWIVDNTGRDVEKDLWNDAMRVWCGQKEYEKVCDKMAEVAEELFR